MTDELSVSGPDAEGLYWLHASAGNQQVAINIGRSKFGLDVLEEVIQRRRAAVGKSVEEAIAHIQTTWGEDTSDLQKRADVTTLRAAITAKREAAVAQAVPPGHAIVPVEPTEAKLIAARQCLMTSKPRAAFARIAQIWFAMLTAVKKPT